MRNCLNKLDTLLYKNDFIITARYDGEWYPNHFCEHGLLDVTHCMPLPEPPKTRIKKLEYNTKEYDE